MSYDTMQNTPSDSGMVTGVDLRRSLPSTRFLWNI
eukprot:CAMPEP_0116967594 /NCGR_PEP_ID=MMETSP0467-20121206/50670_1 /TAXON_ID=283647 /ORGANISM="Mesodinium pulex, Strain SPMC105" /LENGTH=34 /DNA_ID= /DNA_START= /DNA_END= /DNA_ORIENTATION=